MECSMSQISSPADRDKIKKMLAEISGSMTRMEAERDLVRETIKDMSKQFNLPVKTLNRMAKVYHKQNYNQEVAEHEEFEELYETIVQEKSA
jgi:ssDNA-specific exonuclease RecJ